LADHGGRKIDTLSGGGGDDQMTGVKGNDRLIGGRGDDRIADLRDNNRISCGEGNDAVVTNPQSHVAANCEQVTRR
jgi:Ca2+-binding RTX toxin-like protein